MKTIRYITAGLLLLRSIYYTVFFLFAFPNIIQGFIYLIPGVINLIPAVLLIMKKKFALYWGIILAFTSLVRDFMLFFGINNVTHVFMVFLFAISGVVGDAGIIVFCSILLKKGNWVKSL
jgi:hypothetical protein